MIDLSFISSLIKLDPVLQVSNLSRLCLCNTVYSLTRVGCTQKEKGKCSDKLNKAFTSSIEFQIKTVAQAFEGDCT